MIKKIQINHFRNIEYALIEPNPKLNLILGENGQGKTNLIEAIYYIGHNKSYKTKKKSELIQLKKDQFLLKSINHKTKVSILKSSKNNILTIDNQKESNNLTLLSLYPTQLISPDKGFVVGGNPKDRRYYLDWGVFHMKHSIAQTVKNHQNNLKNINNLLFSGHKNTKKEIDSYFYLLAKQSSIINQAREYYLNNLKKIFKVFSLEKIDKENTLIKNFNFELNLGWGNQIDNCSENDIFNFLLENKKNIIDKKILNYGSHRADIIFKSNNKTTQFFSRGQQKILSFVFWILQTMYLIQEKKPPILLIDDIHSELDDKNLYWILDILIELDIQIIMTNIQSDNRLTCYPNIKKFNIQQGKVTPFL